MRHSRTDHRQCRRSAGCACSVAVHGSAHALATDLGRGPIGVACSLSHGAGPRSDARSVVLPYIVHGPVWPAVCVPIGWRGRCAQDRRFACTIASARAAKNAVAHRSVSTHDARPSAKSDPTTHAHKSCTRTCAHAHAHVRARTPAQSHAEIRDVDSYWYTPAHVRLHVPARTGALKSSRAHKRTGAQQTRSRLACLRGRACLQECGGSAVCQHQRLRATCKQCGGAQSLALSRR